MLLGVLYPIELCTSPAGFRLLQRALSSEEPDLPSSLAVDQNCPFCLSMSVEARWCPSLLRLTKPDFEGLGRRQVLPPRLQHRTPGSLRLAASQSGRQSFQPQILHSCVIEVAFLSVAATGGLPWQEARGSMR